MTVHEIHERAVGAEFEEKIDKGTLNPKVVKGNDAGIVELFEGVDFAVAADSLVVDDDLLAAEDCAILDRKNSKAGRGTTCSNLRDETVVFGVEDFAK